MIAPKGDDGAHTRDRTGDLILTKDTLCQLSYVGCALLLLTLSSLHQPSPSLLGQALRPVDGGGFEPP